MALPVVVGSRRLDECWGLVWSVLNKLKGILLERKQNGNRGGFPKWLKLYKSGKIPPYPTE